MDKYRCSKIYFQEYDFKVRWPIVKLLVGLLQHKPKDLQECILVSPMGVSRLMDLLSDTREIIRNEVNIYHVNHCSYIYFYYFYFSV